MPGKGNVDMCLLFLRSYTYIRNPRSSSGKCPLLAHKGRTGQHTAEVDDRDYGGCDEQYYWKQVIKLLANIWLSLFPIHHGVMLSTKTTFTLPGAFIISSVHTWACMHVLTQFF